MNHGDALRELSVEKYLLGELSGTARDEFEEHLFDCEQCTADLKGSVVFAQAARVDLAASPAKAQVREEPLRQIQSREKGKGWAALLLHPRWLVPALAACLLLIGYETLVRVPELKQQVAQADSPRVLNNLVLADGALRGAGVPHIGVARGAAVLLSVDLPQDAGYSIYLCSLYAPGGRLVWKQAVALSPATDTVQIGIPEAATEPGENTLLIEGVRAAAPDAAPVELARHPFVLELQDAGSK